MSPTTQTTQWVLEWFKKNGNLPNLSEEQVVVENYVDRGWIDSVGIIDLIMEAEESFEVQFSQEHFDDARFLRIGGFAEIVDEIRAKN